jgi:NACalpha-BTF3-like transcription factor
MQYEVKYKFKDQFFTVKSNQNFQEAETRKWHFYVKKKEKKEKNKKNSSSFSDDDVKLVKQYFCNSFCILIILNYTCLFFHLSAN